MDCTQFRELASAAVDNEITPDERTALDEHIAKCPECKGWLSAFQILHEELPELAFEPPPELRERVSKSLSMMSEKKPSFFSRYKFTAVAAVAAIVIFAASGGISEYFPKDTQKAAQTADQEDISYRSHTVSESKILPRTELKPAETQSDLALAREFPYDEDFAFTITVHDDSVPKSISEISPDTHDGIDYYIVDSAIVNDLISQLDEMQSSYELTFGEDAELPHGLMIIE